MTHLVEREAVLRQRHSGSRCPHATGKGPTARQGFKAVSNGDNSSSKNNNNNTITNNAWATNSTDVAEGVAAQGVQVLVKGEKVI